MSAARAKCHNKVTISHQSVTKFRKREVMIQGGILKNRISDQTISVEELTQILAWVCVCASLHWQAAPPQNTLTRSGWRKDARVSDFHAEEFQAESSTYPSTEESLIRTGNVISLYRNLGNFDSLTTLGVMGTMRLLH